jgi:hypothetical protein
MRLYIAALHVQRNRWIISIGYDEATPPVAEAAEVRCNGPSRLVLHPDRGGALEVWAVGFVIEGNVLTFLA